MAKKNDNRSPGIEFQDYYERYLAQRPHRITSGYQYIENLHRAARLLKSKITPQLFSSPDAVNDLTSRLRDQASVPRQSLAPIKTALQRYADMVAEDFKGRFGVTPLLTNGRRLLAEIVKYIETHQVDSQNPATYPSYDELYRAVNPNAPAVACFVGHSLRKQDLDDLNEWTMTNKSLPKVTGLIVGKSTRRPGNGFFPSYNKTSVMDDAWWHEEVKKSLVFDWSPFIGTQQAGSPIAIADDLDDDEIAPRVKGQISRIVRDTKIVRKVKALHGHTCQLCANRLELSPGTFYSEAHHLQPLGKPHHGPDKTTNIVCVCPNCHVKLDYHAVRIDSKLLRLKPGHTISQKYIDHHNNYCA